MPTSDQPSPRRRDAHAEYYYRRELGSRELVPAVVAAVGAGLFAFYVTRLLLQRTPLMADRAPRARSQLGRAGGGLAGGGRGRLVRGGTNRRT